MVAIAVGACAGAAGPGPSPRPTTTSHAGPPAPVTAQASPSRSASALPSPPTADQAAENEPAGLAAQEAAVESRPAPALDGLVAPDGSPFELADLRGSTVLLFFGYTHCPDVCPTTIGELFGVIEARPDVRAVFVSVDPERDTPAFLATWTEHFPERFQALTGSPGAIRRVADAYGVRYARVETTSTAGYTMSHTADVYLIDPDGRLRRTYPFGTSSATMVADLSQPGAG